MTTMLDDPKSVKETVFMKDIHAFLSDEVSAADTAKKLAEAATTAPSPATALWELWDAFFSAACDPISAPADRHPPLLALLDALRQQSAAKPTRINAAADSELKSLCNAAGALDWAALPRFAWQWRDTHDLLQAWRETPELLQASRDTPDRRQAGRAAPHKPAAAAKFRRLAALSARLVAGTPDLRACTVEPIFAFFACRDALEYEGPQHWEAAGGKGAQQQQAPERLPAAEVWALDVRVAAAWVVGGAGKVLYEAGNEGVGEAWQRALQVETELYPKDDGLSEARWRLWAEQFESLSREERFDEEARQAAKEASGVILDLLPAGGKA